MNFNRKNAFLVLSNGVIFKGKSLGACGETIGEIVFQTSMVGYQETLTDPANSGLIVTQTFPLMGNYGVNNFCNESDKPYLNGYIVRETCDNPSNFRCEGTLDDYLFRNNVVGICDIDTRKLTRIIRQKGAMNGMIIVADEIDVAGIVAEIKDFSHNHNISDISTPNFKSFTIDNPLFNVAILDVGVKNSLITSLNNKGCNVTVVPANCDGLHNFDGVVISDGPSNPSELQQSLDVINGLFQKDIPMLGIGLGHNLMALACGCNIRKMKCGHRGSNQPVRNLSNSKTYITSQNHGYVVSKIADYYCDVTYINANDQSIEGLAYIGKKSFSVQFTPDSKHSMVSTNYIYDEFIKIMEVK